MWGGAEVGRRYHRRVPLVVSIALFSLLAVFAAAMLWQERRGVPERAVVYGVEDSIEFVHARLDRTDVTKTDVRRILEWSVRYLQDPAAAPAADEPPVMAGADHVAYVVENLTATGDVVDPSAVEAVLRLQTDYVAALGAVGSPVEDGAGDPRNPGGVAWSRRPAEEE